MNKTQLVAAVAATGLTHAQAKEAVNAALKAIAETLVAGEKVALLGFGTFAVNERPARQGKNPRTGEKITIEAKKVVKFKAGAELAKAVQ